MNDKIIIRESRDYELVWSLVHDKSVFNRICNDDWMAKPVKELKQIVQGMVLNPRNHIIVVYEEAVATGCAICYAMGDGEMEVHTCFSDRCRGLDAIKAGKMATQYMLSLPDVEKLVSLCPANLPETYWFARACGWEKGGVHDAKWIKDGIENEMRVVFATKKDLQCPLQQ